MRSVIRREPEWSKEQRRDRRLYRRDVVSVVEVYRTKRKNEPVGEATLVCGHKTMVDMGRRAHWRICWTCWKEGRTAVNVPAAPPPGESKGRAGATTDKET